MDRKELDSLVTRIRSTCNALADDALKMLDFPAGIDRLSLAYEMVFKAEEIEKMTRWIREDVKDEESKDGLAA